MDKRLSKLRIRFPEGWKDISIENPDGPPTFVKENVEESGILQISTAEYLTGKIPNPSLADLIDLSKNVGLKNEFGSLESEESGKCDYGTFGTAQFSRPDFPLISVWHLSDGKSFVFATFICTNFPDQKQIDEVKGVLISIKNNSFFRSLFE
ncbi:MAG TPA: hypothetical protein VGM30_05170 [Puia sp.]|jgi:hypothetical protein